MTRYRYMLLVLVGLIVSACGDDDEKVERCDALECVSLACGNLTPDGVQDTLCTCELAVDTYVTCNASR